MDCLRIGEAEVGKGEEFEKMTAITAFFVEDGDELIVISDRMVTYDREIREKDKFFNKGRFYIFCSGFEDVYMQIILEISNNRTNIANLANFIKRRYINILGTTSKISENTNYECSFILVDKNSLKTRLIRRGGITELLDFDIIGAGCDYTRDVYEIFSNLAPTGFQLKNIKWNAALKYRIIEAYRYLASKQPTIGHPAIFGLDIFVFENPGVTHFKVTFNSDINNFSNYKFDEVV